MGSGIYKILAYGVVMYFCYEWDRAVEQKRVRLKKCLGPEEASKYCTLVNRGEHCRNV